MAFAGVQKLYLILNTVVCTHRILNIHVQRQSIMEATTTFNDSQIKLGLATATISLFFLYKMLSTKKSIYKLPPGPKGWPIIGNLYGMKIFFWICSSWISTDGHLH